MELNNKYINTLVGANNSSEKLWTQSKHCDSCINILYQHWHVQVRLLKTGWIWKQLDVWIRKRSFLPSPSVEWGDKKMGSADHSFASDMAFSSRLFGRKSSAAWLWLLRAYLHEGTPFVLFFSLSVSVWVSVCVCLVKKATWSHSSLTLLFHPTWQPTKPAYSAIKIRVSTQTLKTKR